MKPLPLSVIGARRQSGFTLVELLVSLALGLAVLVGLSSVYVAAKQSFRFQETSGRLQEDAVFALEMISRDLRMAGYAGCRGVDSATISSVVTYFPNLALAPPAPAAITGANPLAVVFPTDLMVKMQPLSPVNFVRGFDNVPGAMFAAGAVPTTGTTDSLFFSGGSANAVSLTAVMASATAPLTIGADAYGWGTANTYTMVISDCVNSSLFAGKVAAGGTQIDHSNAMGNSSNLLFPATPTDAFPLNSVYGVDALVMPLEWSFYYVATRAGASTPSLYRVFYNGTTRGNAEELVSNIETMKLNYGENINGKDTVTNLQCTIATGGATCAPTFQADVWRTTAAAVTDWSRVVAVRVGLMMLSADGNANPDITSTPTLLGLSYTVPVGASTTRLRKEFSTTVVLRNRVAAR